MTKSIFNIFNSIAARIGKRFIGEEAVMLV
jgi:hypothetical protein